MADSDSLGAVDDAVRLTLGGDQVLVATSYEVHQGILSQPAAFSIRLGHGDVARALSSRYPPRTRFELSIGSVRQQTGYTDGYELSSSGSATEVTIKGRDNLAQLHDAYVTADNSYTNLSFADLVEKVIDESGYGTTVVKHTNEANRSALSGLGVRQTKAPRDPKAASAGAQKALQAKVGERRYHFLHRVLATAGFFLWCAGDGSFILSEPNAHQQPTTQIVRKRGSTRNLVSVTQARHVNDTAGRFSDAIVYARGGGRSFNRQKTKGTFADDEMLRWGISNRPIVLRDANVTSAEQAEFYARRQLAEGRRAGWTLEYTVTGHTTAALAGGRAVWAPDTVVAVDDDEFGIRENLYIESVVFGRGDHGTTTRLRLMRPGDLIFGGDP